MPVDFTFEPDAPVLWVRLRGSVCDADLDRLVSDLIAEPRAATSNAIYDLREVSDLSGLTSEAIRRFASAPQCREEAHTGMRLAVLASSDLAFGIGRMFQTLASDRLPYVAVVRDAAAARAFAAEGVAPPGHDFAGVGA